MSCLGRLLSATLQSQSCRPALCINGKTTSYRDIDGWSRRIAGLLRGQIIGILAGASLETYAGVLAVARSGRTYVPFNADLPDDRLLRLFQQSGMETLIVDRQHLARVRNLLHSLSNPLKVVIMNSEDEAKISSSGQHHIAGINESSEDEALNDDAEVSDETPLYIMSTSGSTGEPKRIAIPRYNVVDYVNSVQSIFDFHPDDRFSHFFKLSFDLSVHDIFVTWITGGCLYIPAARDLLDPVAFARRHALTVWFSVPSLLTLAMMTRKLGPDRLPDLRHALFCGEAFGWEAALTMQAAAPNARVTNLYGPTEATIAITHHSIDKTAPSPESYHNPVPIGRVFDGQEAIVVQQDLSIALPGEPGELLLGGSQLAPGYLNNDEQTRKAFVDHEFDGFQNTRWYRTGDIVTTSDDGLVFLGRSDTQIKFRGHRVELGEIEAVLQRVAKTPLAIVIPCPPFGTGPINSLLAFIMPPHNPADEVQAALRNHLPAHMVPTRLVTLNQPIDSLLNANQKVDRAKIAKIYEDSVG
ncbi:MAG: amino acid adenylation domain-containing protein [Geminicoccales bacterium]